MTLGSLDLAVTGACVLVMVAIGLLAGRRGGTTGDFLLARGRIPAWAACLSFVATEVSAVTLISVPATAYRENWQYAQFFIGSFAARAAIAFYFIPAFYRYQVTTIYEFLRHRFGPETQYAAATFFFITRLLASGVRLMAASLAISVLLGWPIAPTIVAFVLVGLIYMLYGGVRAVVWTGVWQALVFLAAGVGSVLFIAHLVPGGWQGAWTLAGDAGRLDFWNWGPSARDPDFWRRLFSDPNIVWIAILNGFFGSLAAFGTDHEMMQRLLTVETRAASQRTMLTTPFLSLGVLLVYLAIGSGLFAFYQTHPGASLPAKLDAIFPHFIGAEMAPGLRGLLVAAILMASIDSPLMSLSASFVNDVYRPAIRPGQSDRHYLQVSRLAIGVFALALVGLAYGFSYFENILWLAFKIGGVTFGSLLGVFLLGIFTTRVGNRGNVVAMVSMAVVNAILLALSETKVLHLGWTWLILIGTAGTFAGGYILGEKQENTAVVK